MPNNRRTPRNRPGGRPSTLRAGRVRRPGNEPAEESTAPRPRLTGRAFVLLLVMLVLLISYASSLRAWLQQHEDTEQARADVAEAKQNIAELERQKSRLKDPAHIEMMARDRFAWVMPGETGYTTLDEDGNVLGERADLSEETAAESESEKEWYAKVWGSVRGAGKEPSEKAESEEDARERTKKNRVVRPERSHG